MDTWFGVDIGGTAVKTAIVANDGTILSRYTFDTLAEQGATDVALRISAALSQCAEEASVAVADVRGVGVGIAGFLDDETGFIFNSPNLGWTDVAFGALLTQQLDRPVAIGNDANVAALGEAHAGAGQGSDNVLMATVGTGVGGGIVIGGRALSGANGMAGEIGHLLVDRVHPLLCGCGRYGCLETRASATAIIRAARERQAAGELPTDREVRGAADVFLLAETKHAAAEAVLEEAADWLGYGLSLCATVLNPEVIVIGGGVSKAGEPYRKAVARAFASYALPRTVDGATVRLAQLGNDAGTVGAARLAQLNSQHA